MCWEAGWAVLNTFNYLFYLLDFTTTFNVLNILSIIGPIGNLAVTGLTHFLQTTNGPNLFLAKLLAEYIPFLKMKLGPWYLNPPFGVKKGDLTTLFVNLIASA